MPNRDSQIYEACPWVLRKPEILKKLAAANFVSPVVVNFVRNDVVRRHAEEQTARYVERLQRQHEKVKEMRFGMSGEPLGFGRRVNRFPDPKPGPEGFLLKPLPPKRFAVDMARSPPRGARCGSPIVDAWVDRVERLPELYAEYNDDGTISEYKKIHIREDLYVPPKPFQEPADAKGIGYDFSEGDRFDDAKDWRGGERLESGAEMPEDFVPRPIQAFQSDPEGLVAFGSRAKPQERAGPNRDADNARVRGALEFPTAIRGPWRGISFGKVRPRDRAPPDSLRTKHDRPGLHRIDNMHDQPKLAHIVPKHGDWEDMRGGEWSDVERFPPEPILWSESGPQPVKPKAPVPLRVDLLRQREKQLLQLEVLRDQLSYAPVNRVLRR
jgi:hypothetical protein